MIKECLPLFVLSTRNTTLVLSTDTLQKVTTEYYGPRLKDDIDYSSILHTYGAQRGRSTFFEGENQNISPNDIPGDFSTPLLGDYNKPSLVLDGDKGGVYDFRFLKGAIIPHRKKTGYPTPHGEAEELVLLLEDKAMEAELELHYIVYEDADVLGRYVVLRNKGKDLIRIQKIASLQLVLEDRGFMIENFYGNWAGEWNRNEANLGKMVYSFGSSTGSSTDYQQPFFIIKKKETSYHAGLAYGFNLIYSGNHLEEIENNSYGEVRILTGINPDHFEIALREGEEFESPEAIMTVTTHGLNGIAHAMHDFVNIHITPERFAFQDRPILYNNWEGTYFKFDEGKILSLAKKAKDFGIELFVLDDGWFGKRDDDKSSLGDYSIYKKKLPHGIAGLSKKIHKLGLKFGLWFEPEAISKDSDLYRAHPEYAICDPYHSPSLGRNQLVLDLTKQEVRDYILDSVCNVLSSAEIDYIKWDYNRCISNIDTHNGAFFHQYVLGLYQILEEIQTRFPDLLMENCASGGSRNDLGMFCYFAQGWVSDDTDSFQRSIIQSNMALAYPLSVMDNHVSGKTSHQLLRKTGLDTKFDIAAFGVLGYELNLNDLDPIDEKRILAQVEYYKEHRHAFQYGRFDLLEQYEDNRLLMQTGDEKETLVLYVLEIQTPTVKQEVLPLVGFDEEAEYEYAVRPAKLDPRRFGSLINMVTPIHVKEEGKLVNAVSRRFGMDTEKFEGVTHGSILNSGSFRLHLLWSGTGLGEQVRVLGDFGARLYLFKKK